MSEQNENELTVERITKINHLSEAVVCENNHSFLAMNALLIPFTNEGRDLGEIMYADSSWILKRGAATDKTQMYGFLLACPVCRLVHLSGFDKAESSADLMDGMDNQIPERILTPDF